MEQKIATPEQQKWLAKLMGYKYVIQYRPGRENTAADTLSRQPDSPTLHHLFVPQMALWDEIKAATVDDEYMKKITQAAHNQVAGPYLSRKDLIVFLKEEL